MVRKNVLLIINPTAGKMKSKTGMFDIVDLFCKNDYFVSVQTTARRGHATEIVKKHGASFDLIVCCGGDGTLNEVVSGVMCLDRKPHVGYIPAGSTNDFASSMELNVNIAKATMSIIDGSPRSLDVGVFQGQHYFTYIASFGAFTSTSYSTPQNVKNILGHLAYVLEGIKDLAKIQAYPIRFKADGVVTDGDYIFGAVTNSTSVGGIVKLGTDMVDMNDGLFEVVLIKNPKNAADLSKLISAITASNMESEMITFLKTSRIEFQMSEDIPWTLDGEFKKGSEQIVVQNIHNGISMIL